MQQCQSSGRQRADAERVDVQGVIYINNNPCVMLALSVLNNKQALWLPVFQQTSQYKKGCEILCQAPYMCVYPLSIYLDQPCSQAPTHEPGNEAVCNTHDQISQAFLPTFACGKQTKTGDGEGLGMWLQSNLFGDPWQSWSVSNLCFRQKFLRQVLQVTGTSWKEKTTELILTIASTMKVKYCHSASFPGYQHESLGTRLLLQKLLALHWHCSFVARLSMLQILSLASYESWGC